MPPSFSLTFHRESESGEIEINSQAFPANALGLWTSFSHFHFLFVSLVTFTPTFLFLSLSLFTKKVKAWNWSKKWNIIMTSIWHIKVIKTLRELFRVSLNCKVTIIFMIQGSCLFFFRNVSIFTMVFPFSWLPIEHLHWHGRKAPTTLTRQQWENSSCSPALPSWTRGWTKAQLQSLHPEIETCLIFVNRYRF